MIEYYQSFPTLGIKGRFDMQSQFDAVLPDVNGKTVLDIGCNTGAFSVEALKRGANKVIGVEPALDWRLLANGIMKELSLPITVYEHMPDEPFDVVLLLSILHVTENPQELLDKAWSLTKELMIVEVNNRLQETKISLPDNKIHGKNKDNRIVYYCSKV